jgi:O-antigen/teichoic acid export membrane protein
MVTQHAATDHESHRRPVGQSPRGVLRSITHEGIAVLVWKILLYALALGGSILVSRGLGAYGRGVYYLPVIAAQTVLTLGHLSLEQANVFLYASARVALGRLSRQNTFVALVMGTACGALVLAASVTLPGYFRDTPPVLFVLVALMLPFALLGQYASGLLTLGGHAVSQLRLATAVALVQVVLLAAVFVADAVTPGSVLAINLATTAATAFLMVAAVGEGFRPRFEAALLRAGLGHALVLHIGTVLLFLHLRADMFMVKAISGTAALGLYSLAVALAETTLLASDALATVVLARQVGVAVDASGRMALRAIRMSVVIGLPLVLAWLALGRGIIRICFGVSFEPVFWMLAALLPGMIFVGAQRMCGGAVLQSARPGRIAVIQGLSLTTNVALNWWFIRTWGPVGAAAASSLSYGLGATLFAVWCARLAGSPVTDALPTFGDWRAFWRAMLDLARMSGGRHAHHGTVAP